MKRESCRFCKFYKDHCCHRHSPVVQQFWNSTGLAWPPVSSSDWCGDWQIGVPLIYKKGNSGSVFGSEPPYFEIDAPTDEECWPVGTLINTDSGTWTKLSAGKFEKLET